MADDPQLDALMELERRGMSGDPSVTPDIQAKVKARLDAYRAQGLVKPMGRAIPESASKRYEGDVGIYANLKGAVGGFKDDYGGNLVGGLENAAQSLYSGIGTEGQREWWAQFRTIDNQIRNDLFGSALTDSEKRAYEATTVSPSMDPKIIKQNISTRAEIIRKAMTRRTEFMKKNGYNPDAVDALAGEYLPDFAPGYSAKPGAPQDQQSSGDRSGVIDPAGTGDIGFNQERAVTPMSTEQTAAYDLFMKNNPKASAEDITQFMRSIGLTVTNAEDVVKARDEGRGVRSGEDAIFDQELQERARKAVKEQGAVMSGVRGAADTTTLGGADEFGAAVRVLTADNPTTFDRELAFTRAVRDVDREEYPWAYSIGQLAGAFINPLGRNARTPTELMKTGGALSAAYGFGSGDTMEDRVIGAGLTGAAGAVTGLGLGKIIELYGARIPKGRGGGGGGAATTDPSAPVGPDEARLIAGRLGITPTPATVSGGGAGTLQRGLGNLPGSSSIIRDATERETRQLGDAARRVADSLGESSNPQKAGEQIAAGAKEWRKQSKEAGGALYERRDALMGGKDAPVVMGNTGKLFQQFSNEFPTSPALGAMMEHPAVRKMAGAMPDSGDLTLGEATDALSHIRSVVRNAERSNTITGSVKARISALEQAIEDDVMNAARASDAIAGRGGDAGAEAAQKTADAFWADRASAIRGELKIPLESADDNIRVPGERVFRTMFGDMDEKSGNLVRLREAWSRLPANAKQAFSATAFDAMGKAKPSAQNAMDDAWSFQTFLTNWADASDDAKQIVFGGRGVGREINDIVRYASRLRDIDKMRNYSNTAVNSLAGGYVATLASTFAATAATAGPGVATKVTMGLGAVYPALNVGSRLFLKSPEMRSWMRSALKATVRGVTGGKGAEANLQTLVRRLPSIAARNPQIADEITQFGEALVKAANDNAYKATASGSNQEQ